MGKKILKDPALSSFVSRNIKENIEAKIQTEKLIK